MNRYLEAAFATIGIVITEAIVCYWLLRIFGWLAVWRRNRHVCCGQCAEEYQDELAAEADA